VRERGGVEAFWFVLIKSKTNDERSFFLSLLIALLLFVYTLFPVKAIDWGLLASFYRFAPRQARLVEA
jgi:hypothetical protein